jgi:hypothetical protein
MLTRPRARYPQLSAVLLALSLYACGSSSGGGSNTFSCGTLSCASGSQYCLKVESGPKYSCVNLPSSGCTTGMWCETCLASIPNQQSCAEATIGGETDIEVDTTM